MSGRSIGLASVHFSGVRVTGPLTYIPSYTKADGKVVPAKCIIPVCKNSHKGTTVKPDGTVEKGRRDYFKLTAWAKLADIMARSCPIGKALDALCEPRSYMGKLHNADGSFRTDAAGTPIDVQKISFNMIVAPVFGEESQNQIDKEIKDGKRPANWDVKGHPDYEMWTNILKARQAYSWDGVSDTFLYARVKRPTNGTVLVGQPQQQVAQPQAAMPSMVQHAVQTQVAPAPAAVPVAPVAQQFTPGLNINSVI